MVEKAGHWVHHDQTDYFVETVRAFLEDGSTARDP
jgi:pimeloyl-ACP methyl ester carboxylesterase